MPRSSRFRRSCAAVAAVALTLPLAACGDDDDDVASPSGADTPAAESRELTVFAAASLTGAFTELAEEFEAAHPGVEVTFNFGSSGTLATQINEGAPADVFASASPATMTTVTDAGNGAGTAVTFVRNRLEIAVPTGNPGEVEGIEDFADESLDIALCATTAPCGSAADKLFTEAGITPKPDTREADVKAVLTKVEAGEVDAALVYHTDVLSAGDKVEGIEFEESDLAINDYLITALKDSDEAELAADWVEFVQTDEAQDALVEAGFESADEDSADASPSASPSSTASTASTSSEDDEESEESPSASPTS